MGTSPPAIPAATAPFEAFSLLLGAPWHCSVLPWQHMTGWLHHSPSPVLVKSRNPDGTFACRYSSAPHGSRGAVAQHMLTDAHARHGSTSGHQPPQCSSGAPHPTSPEALPQAPAAPASCEGVRHQQRAPTRTRLATPAPGPGHLTGTASSSATPSSQRTLSALVYSWSLSPHWGASHNRTPVNKPYVLQSWEVP